LGQRGVTDSAGGPALPFPFHTSFPPYTLPSSLLPLLFPPPFPSYPFPSIPLNPSRVWGAPNAFWGISRYNNTCQGNFLVLLNRLLQLKMREYFVSILSMAVQIVQNHVRHYLPFLTELFTSKLKQSSRQ